MIFKKPVLSDGITESTFECKRDGLTIRGTIYRPKGDHLPIAIVCHGFMAWQDSVKHYAAFWLKWDMLHLHFIDGMQSGRFCVCFGGSKEQLSDRKTCPVLSGIVYPG